MARPESVSVRPERLAPPPASEPQGVARAERRATSADPAPSGRRHALELLIGVLVAGAGAAAVLLRRLRRPSVLGAQARATLDTEAALQEMIAEERARGASPAADDTLGRFERIAR